MLFIMCNEFFYKNKLFYLLYPFVILLLREEDGFDFRKGARNNSDIDMRTLTYYINCCLEHYKFMFQEITARSPPLGNFVLQD